MTLPTRPLGTTRFAIAAATLEPTERDLDEIAAAIEATGAGSGPVRPPATTGTPPR